MRARLAMLNNKGDNDPAAVAASLPELPEPKLTEPCPTPFIPAAVLDELLLEPTGRDDVDDEEGGKAAV